MSALVRCAGQGCSELVLQGIRLCEGCNGRPERLASLLRVVREAIEWRTVPNLRTRNALVAAVDAVLEPDRPAELQRRVTLDDVVTEYAEALAEDP